MTRKVRTLLLDADIVAYAVAARNESRWDFAGDGNAAVWADQEAAEKDAQDVVTEIADTLKASNVIVCLSDASSRYFRHDLYPAYKSRRKSAIKPQLLAHIKDCLAATHTTYRRPALEADDCQGILATNRKLQAAKGMGETVIVSADKDMRGVPGRLYNPNRPEQGVQRISEPDADRFHLWQTLVGDNTDGYPGCPGIGPESPYAQEIIGAARDELWDIVLDAYASKGLSEADAILQARLARILRSQDWNYQENRPRLWSPLTLYGAYET